VVALFDALVRLLPEASAGIRRDKVAFAPTQSPAVIAGLRRIATSLWLRFVASPQRMPIFRYRRWGRSVVNVIYRVPPRRRFLQHRQYLVATNSRTPGCMVFFMRYRIQPAMSHLREPIYESHHMHFQPTLTRKKLQAGQHRRCRDQRGVIRVGRHD
jgi:hypothetical protein